MSFEDWVEAFVKKHARTLMTHELFHSTKLTRHMERMLKEAWQAGYDARSEELQHAGYILPTAKDKTHGSTKAE